MASNAETIDLIGAVSRSIRRHMRGALAPFDIPPALARALRVLDQAREPMRMSDLADALRIERRSATDVVEQLVERGFVERRSDPADKRATVIELTGDGARMVTAIAKIRTSVSHKAAAPLEADEVAELHRLLTKLLAADDCER